MLRLIGKAISDTLGSRWLVPVIVLEVAVGLAARAAKGGLLVWLGYIGYVFLIGYGVSYSRSAILDDEPRLPPLRGFWTHLRRGLSLFACVLPAVFVFSLPSLLIATFVASESVQRVLFGALMTVAAALATVTVQARYASFDRLREGLRYSGAVRGVWAHPGMAAAPVLLVLANVSLQRLVGTAAAGMAPAGRAIAQAAASVVGCMVALVMSHLVGQVARVAFADEVATESL